MSSPAIYFIFEIFTIKVCESIYKNNTLNSLFVIALFSFLIELAIISTYFLCKQKEDTQKRNSNTNRLSDKCIYLIIIHCVHLIAQSAVVLFTFFNN